LSPRTGRLKNYLCSFFAVKPLFWLYYTANFGICKLFWILNYCQNLLRMDSPRVLTLGEKRFLSTREARKPPGSRRLHVRVLTPSRALSTGIGEEIGVLP